MKKLLLALGSIAAVAAPVASVVACGAPKQKHVKLDADKIEALVPDLTTAVETAVGHPGFLTGAKHEVVENGNNFDVTYKHGDVVAISVTVTPDGKVTEFKMAGTDGHTLADATADQLAAVQKVMEGGTIDHSNDSTDATSYDRDSIDDTVATAAGLTVPDALADGATMPQIRTFNAQVEAFTPLYQQALSDAAAKVINGILSLNMDKAEFDSLVIPYGILTSATLDALKVDVDSKTKLLKYIDDGAKIEISKAANNDISGSIEVNGKQGQFNFRVEAMLDFNDVKAKPQPAYVTVEASIPTVHVDLNGKTFKNQIDADAALGLKAEMEKSGATLTVDSIKHVKVEAILGNDVITKEADVATTGTNQAQNLNNAIQAIGTEIAKESAQIIDTDAAYIAEVNKALTGLAGSSESEKANALFEAIGNPTRFEDNGKSYIPVFGTSTAFTNSLKDEIKLLLAPFIKAFPTINLVATLDTLFS